MNGKSLDLAGQVFGRLTVLGLHSRKKFASGSSQAYLSCRCVCGTEKVVSASNLRHGTTRSCGCLNREKSRTHGLSKTREHRQWRSAKARTLDDKHPAYHRYGGRGITMSDEFAQSFAAFLEHVGPCPSPRHTLDRIDNDRGYERGNLRWATRAAQARNRSTTKLTEQQATEILALRGTGTQAEIAEGYGVHQAVVSGIHRGKLWKKEPTCEDR